MRVTVDYADDESERSPHCAPVFEFTFYMMPTIIEFTPEQGRRDWKAIADTIAADGSATFDWGCGNGESSIHVNGAVTTFTIAKYGDGCGGLMSFTAPSKALLSAFTFAAEKTDEWLSRN